MEIRMFEIGDSEAVIALWEATDLARSWNSPRADIERKLKCQPELFLVGAEAGEVVAVVMGGYDGHRGHVNYFAVRPDRQGHGLGRQLLAHLEALLIEMGCPKVNLQVRLGNDQANEFYEHVGYERFEVVDFGRRLIPDQ